MRDIPSNKEPGPNGVKRVDISKTGFSIECPQKVYSPLLEKAIPNSYSEIQPFWLVHMPTRLLNLIKNHQVRFSCGPEY